MELKDKSIAPAIVPTAMNDDLGAKATVPEREICFSAIVGGNISLAIRLTVELVEEVHC